MGYKWSKFYWSDWLGDEALRLCSFAAKGLWIDMLCIMATSEKPGYLFVGGHHLTTEELARRLGAPIEEVEPLLAELEARRVVRRDKAKNLYSKRIESDENRARIFRESGKKGGQTTRSKQKGIFQASKGGDKGSEKEPNRVTLESRIQNPEREIDNSLSESSTSRPRAAVRDGALDELRRAANGNVDDGATNIEPIAELIAQGADFDADVIEIVRQNVPRLRQPLRTWGAMWFRNAVLEHRADRLGAEGVRLLPDPEDPERRTRLQRNKVSQWLTGMWPPTWGPEPDDPASDIPIEVVENVMREHGRDLTHLKNARSVTAKQG